MSSFLVYINYLQQRFSVFTQSKSMNVLLYLSYVNISVRPIHTESILM